MSPASTNEIVVPKMADASSEMSVSPETQYRLSGRGAYNFSHEDHWAPIERALDNPWTPENPSGTIMMRLAENSLMHDEISEYIRKHLSVDPVVHLTYGQGPRGSVRLRKAVASFFNTRLHVREPVGYGQIIVMSGVTSVMDALVWSICNEGDGILIPQPLYTGFRIDISERSRGVILPVPFRGVEGYSGFDDAFEPEVARAAFERAYEDATRRGIKVRAALLTNPHNPLGRCYGIEAVKEVARFCALHDLHLISNEIYAYSVFRDNGAVPFASVLSMDLGGVIEPSLVHVVYGASKDFCANGLRLGVICSRNEGVLRAVASLSPFSWTPYIMQDIWASMLEDQVYLDKFFAKNQGMMAENYALLTSILDERGIPYYNGGNAAMFLWMDLSRYFVSIGSSDHSEVSSIEPGSKSWQLYLDREEQIDDTFMKNGVSIAKGSIFFTEELGWFRITFTLPREALLEGVKRMMASLEEIERNDRGGKKETVP